MTVRPGDDWGTSEVSPTDAVVVHGDADLAGHVAVGERRALLLRGGDLHRTVGAPHGPVGSRRLPIDLLQVDIDGAVHIAAAHVVARAPGRAGWWRGPIVAVMNAEYIGRWDVAPRSHPNDGKLDVVAVDAAMGRRQRWQAWRRLPMGAHVPHPSIEVRRRSDAAFQFEQPLAVFVDGVERARTRSFTVSVAPDAAVVHV